MSKPQLSHFKGKVEEVKDWKTYIYKNLNKIFKLFIYNQIRIKIDTVQTLEVLKVFKDKVLILQLIKQMNHLMVKYHNKHSIFKMISVHCNLMMIIQIFYKDYNN